MKRYLLFLLVLLTLLSGLTLTTTRVVHAATSSCVNPNGTNTLQGTLGVANYTIAVPSNWNGTLVLYSHGYVFPNKPLLYPAPDAGDPLTGAALLQQGYALAGSSYSQNGWALQQAFNDQIALLDHFNVTCGTPARTIAWGHSLGGIITAGLVQLFPGRFAGALPMCGVVAGGVGTWNQALDSAFAFNVLLGGMHCQSFILLIPRALSTRPRAYSEKRSKPLRVGLASPCCRPWQTFPVGLILPHLNPRATTSAHRSRINFSGKARLTSLLLSLPVLNSNFALAAIPPGIPV